MCTECPHNKNKSMFDCPFHKTRIRDQFNQIYTICGSDYDCNEPERFKIENKSW